MMSISDTNGKLLYRNLTEINQDDIIDAIVRAGGVNNIDIFIDLDVYPQKESVEGIRFLKTIGYDISNINIFTCSPDIGVELIKQ